MQSAMTIAAAFVTEEGVVLGADSTTTVIFRETGREKFYNNAQKVFEIGVPGQSRFGLVTYGDGKLGKLSHRTVVARLSEKIRSDTRVQDLVADLVSLGCEAECSEGREFVGYYVGGIEPGTFVPSGFNVTFGKAGQEPRVQRLDPRPYFDGAPRFVFRALLGFDFALPDLVWKAWAKKHPAANEEQAKIEKADLEAAFVEAIEGIPRVYSGLLPLRDALDFLDTYLQLSVKSHKFLIGSPICGGAVELAVITADRPFRWVRHKPFDSALRDDQ